MENMEHIGQIYLTTNRVVVADPCYGRNTVNDENLACKVDLLRSGAYDAYIGRCEDDGRIANLCIVVAGTNIEDVCYGDWELGQAAVDSGTCGIFDNNYHKETHYDKNADDDWYDEFVMGEDGSCPEINITDDKGVLSSSGYGDGCYPVFVVTDQNGNEMGICVEYIYEGYED